MKVSNWISFCCNIACSPWISSSRYWIYLKIEEAAPISSNAVCDRSSDNEAVATVSQNGLVSANELGTALIRVMTADQVHIAVCDIAVVNEVPDETNVSFKSAAHIDPSAAATKVMAHEQEQRPEGFRAHPK